MWRLGEVIVILCRELKNAERRREASRLFERILDGRGHFHTRRDLVLGCARDHDRFGRVVFDPDPVFREVNGAPSPWVGIDVLICIGILSAMENDFSVVSGTQFLDGRDVVVSAEKGYDVIVPDQFFEFFGLFGEIKIVGGQQDGHIRIFRHDAAT